MGIKPLGCLCLGSSIKSSRTFSLAKGWIEDCLKNHPECSPPSEGVWVPTRLLDCELLDAPEPTIRLIETKAQCTPTPCAI